MQTGTDAVICFLISDLKSVFQRAKGTVFNLILMIKLPADFLTALCYMPVQQIRDIKQQRVLSRL